MPNCPYCHAKHVWGLHGRPARAGDCRHGLRLPHHGERLRCGNCGEIIRVDVHLARKGLRRLVLKSARQAQRQVAYR